MLSGGTAGFVAIFVTAGLGDSSTILYKSRACRIRRSNSHERIPVLSGAGAGYIKLGRSGAVVHDHKSVIGSVEQFVGLVSADYSYGVMFRGVTDFGRHSLVPSLGRHLNQLIANGMTNDDLLTKEHQALRILRAEIRFHESGMRDDDWHLLVLAQHHGMSTRLLDWSLSALTALYFAVEQPFDGDSAVFVLPWQSEFLSIEEERKVHPFELNKVRAFLPPHVSPRIRVQDGLFTIHPDPTATFDCPELVRFRVAASARKKIKLQLNLMGINRKALFPDLDGLCKWLEWQKFGALTH